MKIKSAAGLILATTFMAAVGPIHAACYKNEPGWHMVSKKCDIKPADNWQEYKSGVYTQPITGKSLL
ncbi:hypothetical protein LEAN103870_07625 [Legionella anisa]|uniref:DUF3012 domain-containing protein n=1 Tax=Legionella anisa TaxID=28082 RepID=A0AAX0WSW9_9GAMM|nr:hypothetical protein [Legionella anisa]AWN74525.1 hypothetical protein DLD14_12090 [Legionella anisa]KTC76588.1 hypothetical protein Lani_0318 [Legionella anisa]MBN5935734.1 hypothetical protein [Legionella anisa]MCW8425362.1 hypothetical protein [Legionella anisa]MCW8449207.1 hypothetical protein [Legionella anisa]